MCYVIVIEDERPGDGYLIYLPKKQMLRRLRRSAAKRKRYVAYKWVAKLPADCAIEPRQNSATRPDSTSRSIENRSNPGERLISINDTTFDINIEL